jgi:hypothetical protein
MEIGRLCRSAFKIPQWISLQPGAGLAFMNLASQKNFIAVYHMGVYANKELFKWFQTSYPKATGKKPEIGKSCMRSRNLKISLLS